MNFRRFCFFCLFLLSLSSSFDVARSREGDERLLLGMRSAIHSVSAAAPLAKTVLSSTEKLESANSKLQIIAAFVSIWTNGRELLKDCSYECWWDCYKSYLKRGNEELCCGLQKILNSNTWTYLADASWFATALLEHFISNTRTAAIFTSLGYGIPAAIGTAQVGFDVFKIIRKICKSCHCTRNDQREEEGIDNQNGPILLENMEDPADLERLCCCHVQWWQKYFGWFPCCKNIERDRKERGDNLTLAYKMAYEMWAQKDHADEMNAEGGLNNDE